MGSSSMKVHPVLWDNHESQSLTLGCKRFRPLAPKLVDTINNNVVHNHSSSSNNNLSFDLKSFFRTESESSNLLSSSHHKKDSASASLQVDSHPGAGGTRWNPTQEQIGILEMLYKQGMRTPNAQQIEQITEQLSKYGKIEGKNVFYWFQNHKARERQKQKRSILRLSHNPRTPPPPASHHPINTSTTLTLDTRAEIEELEMSPYKRMVRSWTFECSLEDSKKNFDLDEEDKTLELFPLRPEGLLGRIMN